MVANQSDIIGHAMKMVVALRREFGRNIDIVAIVKDQEYARSIIDLAAASANEHLREQAQYLERMIWGPRDGAVRSPGRVATVALETVDRSPIGVGAVAAEAHSADVLNAAKLAKYRRGLR